MTTATTLSLVRSFKDPIIKVVGGAVDEISQLLDDGVSSYVENYRSKFRSGKTFLFQKENVDFEKIYYPISLKSGERVFKVKYIEDLYINRNFTSIIGSAGSGKSMQMKYIFLQCLHQKIKIPIFLELKSLNEYKGSLRDYIYEKILGANLSKNKLILKKILASGEFLFLLDGYDELYVSKKQKITHDLEEFIDENSKNWFIVTSRPEAGFESFPRFRNNYIQSLSEDEINEFIDIQCAVINDKVFAENVKKTIRNSENTTHLDFLGSPLLLSMFLFTFKNYPYLPDSRSRFYWNVLETLMTRHDAFTKKGGWQHERLSNLSNEDIEKVLKWFSYVSLMDGALQFERSYLKKILIAIKDKLNLDFDIDNLIYDLTVNLGFIHLDGITYKFIHRSIQEFLSTLLISEQKNIQIVKKIYNDKLPEYGARFRSFSTIFFDLLVELDKDNFFEHYIIYHLECLKKNLNKSDLNSTIKEFVRFTKAKIHVTRDANGDLEIGGLVYPNSHFIDLLVYVDILESSFPLTKLLNCYIEDSVNLERLHKLVDKSEQQEGMCWLGFEKMTNNDINCFKKYGIERDINILIDKVGKKILYFRGLLDNDSDTTIDLLEI